MAKKITKNDIIEEDIFKGIVDSANEAISKLDEMKKQSEQTAKSLKDSLGKAKMSNVKDLESLVKIIRETNKLLEQKIKIETAETKALQQKTIAERELEKLTQERIKTEREKQKLTTEQRKEAERLTREQEKLKKAQEKATAQAEKEKNAYYQLAKATKELKDKAKTLGAELELLEQDGKKFTDQWWQTKRAFDQTSESASKANDKLKQIDKSVGDNFRNVGNYEGAINKLGAGLGALGLAFGVGDVFRSVKESLTSFDEGVADMSKTLNVSKEEAKGLARELLKIDTRTSVEDLQGIAAIGGQLGISAKDIVGFTNSVDKLNVALGDEFTGGAEEITSVVGGLRNVFADIKSDDVSTDLLNIGNAMNVLGAEGSATSPVMADFAGRIGGVAIPLGLTSGQVLGLSATLQELNVTAERGGTAVGDILKKMAKDTEGFAQLAGMPVKEFEKLVNTDLFGAFQKVVEGTKQFKGNATGLAKVLDGLKLNGAGASEVFLKLGSNMDLLKLRTETANVALTENDSILDEFDKKNETLQAKLDKLSKAFDIYVLGIDESGNATGKLGGVIDFLAENLGTILSVVGKVATAWLVYRGALIAVQAKQYLFNGGLKNTIMSLKDTFSATKKAAEGADDMADGIKNTGRSLGAIPWLAIIGAVIELATAFWDVASGAARAREQAERLDKYKARADKDAQKNIEKTNEALDKQLKQRERDKNLALSKAKTDTERNKIQADYLKLVEQDISKNKAVYTGYIKTVNERKKQYKEEIAFLKEAQFNRNKTAAEQKRVEEIFERLGVTSWTAVEKYFEANDKLEAGVAATNVKLTEYWKEIKNADEALKDATNEVAVNSNELNNNSLEIERNDDKIKAKIPKVKEWKTELKEVNEYLSKQNELLAEIDQLKYEEKIADAEEKIAEARANAIKKAKEEGVIDVGVEANVETQTFGDQYSELEQLIIDRYNLEIEALKSANAEKLKLIEMNYTDQSRIEREKLKEKYDELLLQEGLTAEKKKEIQDNYDAQMEQIRQNDLQRNADYLLEKEKIEREQALQITEINKKKDEDIEKSNEELNTALEEGYDERSEKAKETADKELEIEKEKWKKMKEYADLAADYFIKRSEEKIKQIDKELTESQKQSDYLRELAKNGNIEAQQSLSAQAEYEAELNKKREKELKRQQRIKLAQTAFSTYASKQEAGVKNPLAETIKDITLLQAFINSIPTFEKGTEDTGTNGRGIDGKGGFNAILHPNERVVPKKQNALIGDMSNEELAQIANDYQNGKIMNFKDSQLIVRNNNYEELVSEIKDLKKVIKNKPETNIELGEIIDGAMTIVKNTKHGNSVTYNRYRVK